MKDIRKQPYRLGTYMVPIDLMSIQPKCPFCNTENEVPWLDELEFPKHTIQSIDGKLWAPGSFPLFCKECGNKYEVSVPNKKVESKWTFYGDEASRYIENPNEKYSDKPLHFFCINLVGLHKDKHQEVKRNFYNLKKSIVPGLSPEEWTHHFHKIWDSNPKKRKYQLADKPSKIFYAKKLANVIKDARPYLVSMTFAGCIKVSKDKETRSKQIKFQKEDIFAHTLLASLEYVRQNNKAIRWVFDNIKDRTNNEGTEGWAKQVFLGLQYTSLNP